VNPQVPLLARHFFRRFFDNDLISPDGDGHENLGLVLAFVALPPLFLVLMRLLAYASPWLSPSQRLLMALHDKFQFMASSMIVMALVTVLEWDALALDARDFAVLGPLPIERRTLVAAKLRALLLFVTVFAVAVNAIPIVFFPLAFLSNLSVGTLRGVWVVVVHAACLLGATVFAFFFLLGLRGLLVTGLGPRAFRRVSVALQFVLVLGLVTAYLLLPGITSYVVTSALPAHERVLHLAPPAWFLGLYETLTGRILLDDPGVMTPSWHSLWQSTQQLQSAERHSRSVYLGYGSVFGELGWLAVGALVVAVAGGLALYFVTERRRTAEGRAWVPSPSPPVRAMRWVWTVVATKIAARSPIARATFFFALQALARSARHRLHVAGYLAVGFALAVMTVTPLISRAGLAALRQPSPSLLSLQFVLSFFLLVGVRASLAVPVELRANWIFRLTERERFDQGFAGLRTALRLALVVPFFGVLAPWHAALWGWQTAGLHCVFGMLSGFILIEALLLGFHKVPCACAYTPGKANLKVRWPLYLLAFVVYSYGVSRAEWHALADGGTVVLAGALLVVLAVLAGWRRLLLRRPHPLVFEEPPDPAAVSLGLSG
jgi:hypothetical protein